VLVASPAMGATALRIQDIATFFAGTHVCHSCKLAVQSQSNLTVLQFYGR
jgi:hypothetical protein